MQVKLQGDICMIQGTATKNAVFKTVGSKNSRICEFSLAIGKNQDTTTKFANCKAWHGLAEYAAIIQKGHSVLCIGKVEEREYNGKTYKDFICDWLSVAANVGDMSPPIPTAPPTPQANQNGVNIEPDDDGDSLPF